jgi:hypothetical protein
MIALTPDSKTALHRAGERAKGKIQHRTYHHHRALSTAAPNFLSAGETFDPVHHGDADATAEAVGALTVYLVARILPRQERVFGWALVERWLREMIDARHRREVIA